MNKCSQCGKELPPKDLISFWDSEGDWHYCGGNWRPRHHRHSFWQRFWYKKTCRDCCADFSNHPLFLCEPCYQSYQERKKQTIQREGERPQNYLLWLNPIILCGIVLALLYLFKKFKKNRK